ncbi:MAG TPA: hypothetical protein VKU01_34210 [Bryobacteraceae bacterium]|nr:hypothetical protein [Bryobacteraceae bacterium]
MATEKMSKGLRLARILARRLEIYWANDSVAYFNGYVKPVLIAMAREGYTAEEAIATFSKYRLFQGTLMLAEDAASEALLKTSTRSAAKAFSMMGETLNVVGWVFLMAAPAGAEGLNDPDNQLAYQNYVKKRIGLLMKTAAFSDSPHFIEPPLSPQRWCESIGL